MSKTGKGIIWRNVVELHDKQGNFGERLFLNLLYSLFIYLYKLTVWLSLKLKNFMKTKMREFNIQFMKCLYISHIESKKK